MAITDQTKGCVSEVGRTPPLSRERKLAAVQHLPKGGAGRAVFTLLPAAI